ncbi:MAG: hypothetical protein II806_03655 [Bacteroidaceae bacterium]|nr:hypothetical protein [Bacteroidaceae bacterium]
MKKQYKIPNTRIVCTNIRYSILDGSPMSGYRVQEYKKGGSVTYGDIDEE